MLPQSFTERMQGLLGSEYEEFLASFEHEKYQALRMPMRSTFSDRIFALAGWISFVTSSPSPSIADAIWVLFTPAAAHRSRIRSPGCGDSAVTGDLALGSWIP